VGAVLSAINGADFDSLGNALKSDVATMTYNDEHNRLLRLDDLATGATLREYGYDAAGFVTSIDGAPVTWTAHGRVRTVGVDVALEWDARGRPISQTVLGETTYRMFGGLVEAEAPGLPTSLDLTEVKVDLVGDEHLYRHLGARSNVKFVTNAQGDVVAGYRYDAFGRTQVFGSDADGVRFAQGAEVEGLVVLGARGYDPLAQRFLSPDPVHHLINQYAYPANPVWFWDPDGRRLGWISIGLGAVSMVAAVAAMVVAPAVAVHLAAISLTVGALSLAVAVTQQLIDDGVLQSPAQRKELTLSCACGGGGGGGSGAGQGAGDSVGVAGPGNGPLIVVEGFAFKNGRFRGKVGGPDSAFAAHSSAAPGHGPVGCLGQDTSSPVGPGCASAVPLPLLWLFFRSRMRRRSA